MTLLVSPEFYLEVARGNVPGFSAVDKFGRNDDVDTASEEDIWAGGGVRAYLSSAETMDIASDNAADDGSPEGTGAHTLYIEGLDGSYNEVSETVTLNGTTAVTTSNSYMRVHRAYVDDVGSNESNVGQITIDPTTSGSGSRQGLIEAGDGQTLITHFTVPAGKTAYFVGGQPTVGSKTGSSGAKEVKVRLWIRTGIGKSWRIQKSIGARSDGTSISPDIVHTVPAKYPEKTDFKWTAIAENNNASVFVQYNLILVDN